MANIDKMKLADKSNYVLSKVIKKATKEKAQILYIGINHFDFSFIVAVKIAGLQFEYGYNGTDKIIITCNGSVIDEIIEE